MPPPERMYSTYRVYIYIYIPARTGNGDVDTLRVVAEPETRRAYTAHHNHLCQRKNRKLSNDEKQAAPYQINGTEHEAELTTMNRKKTR